MLNNVASPPWVLNFKIIHLGMERWHSGEEEVERIKKQRGIHSLGMNRGLDESVDMGLHRCGNGQKCSCPPDYLQHRSLSDPAQVRSRPHYRLSSSSVGYFLDRYTCQENSTPPYTTSSQN